MQFMKSENQASLPSHNGSSIGAAHRRVARRRAAALLAVAAASTIAGVFSPTSAVAGVFTWDPVGDASGSGGVGTWDTTTSEWLNGTDTTWPDTNSSITSTAVFGGTGGAVAIQSAGIYANGLTFNSTGYVLGGGTLNIGGTTPTITTNANATIGSVIAGSGGLITSGSGTLILTQGNSYSGGTTISGGTLQLNNSGAAPGTITLAGGTLDLSIGSNFGYGNTLTFTANSTIGDIGTGQVNLEGGTINGNGKMLTINNGTATNLFYFNDTSGSTFAGILVQAGYAAEELDNGTPLRSAPMTIANGAGFATYANGTVNNNITLNGGNGPGGNGVLYNQGGTATYSGTISLASGNSVINTAGGNIVFSGAVTSAGSLTVTGGNTLSLSAVETYSGSTTISAGTTLAITGTGQLSSTGSSGTYAGTITNNGKFIYNSSATDTLSAAINGAGSIVVSAGRLVTQAGITPPTTNTGANISVSIGSGAVLEFNYATNLDGGANTTFSGAGTLRKTGTGQLQWGGTAATFNLGSGSLIDVEGGTFIGGSNGNEVWTNNLSSLYVASGATFNGVEANVNVDALNGPGTVQGGYSNQGSITVGDNNGSGTFSGVLSNSGNNGGVLTLIKSGTGTQVVTGADTYTGSTTVSAGALNIQSSSALGTGTSTTTSRVTVVGGGALQIQGGITTITAVGLTLNGTGVTAAPNGALENVSGINNYSGLVTLASNAAIGSDSGTLNLTNANTISGSGFGLTLTGAGNGSLASVIGTGAGGVTKTGAGTWVLSGTSTYTGQTAVSAGRLYVNGSLNSSSAVSVASNAVLGGTGTVGAATVAGGGSIEGGQNGLGELTLSSLTFSSAGNINLGGLGNYTSTPAIATGALTTSGVANSVTLNVTGTIPAVGTYEAVSYGGSITNTDYTLATLPSRATGALDFTHPGLIDIDITGTDFIVWTGATTNTWDTTNNNWKLNSNGTPTAYIDSPPDKVVFDDSAGSSYSTVNISGNDVHPLSVTFNNSTNNYLLQGTNAIAGSTGLTKAGSAQLTITNANTYTGATTISGGTLQLGDGTSGDDGSLTTSGITNSAALVYNLFGTQTATYPISGSGTLSKVGGGTLVLAGSNSYGGGTTVSAGTLQLGTGSTSLTTSGSPAGTGTFSVAAGTVLKFNFVSNTSAYNFSQITGAGTVELTSTNEFDWSDNALGSTAAAFSNSFTGTLQIDIGRVPSANLGGVTSVIVNSGGQFATYNNGNGAYTQNFTIAGNYGVESGANGAIRAQNNTFTGNIALSASATIVVGGTSTIAGPISENSAGLSFTLGNPGGYNNGALILTGASSYTGSTTIAIGTLQLGNGTTGKDGSLTTSGITDNAALVYNLFGTETASYPISGSGSLTKSGAGTLVLNASNSYSGGTKLNLGTLRAANNAALNATGAVTIAGGTLALGADNSTVGALGTGAETWNSGGYTAKITNAAAVGGTSIDQITMSGLTVGSTSGSPFAITLTAPLATTGFNPSQNYDWVIANVGTATGISTGSYLATAGNTGANVATAGELFTLDTTSFANANPGIPAAGNFFLELEGIGGSQTLDIGYNATPEPGTTLLALAGAMPILAARRRRRRQT
jgi:fibronectin-binding autotransporter adhesin